MFKRILLVDDSRIARTITRRCLEIAGCLSAEFAEAENGKEALEMIRADEYDLVVADINMPVMDGRELLRRIKTSPRLTDLTVLVITSSYNTALVEEMKSLGASKVISKPINPVVIASVLEEISGEYKS